MLLFTASSTIALHMMMTLLQRQPLLIRFAIDNNDGTAVDRWTGRGVGMPRHPNTFAHLAAMVALPSSRQRQNLSPAKYGGDAV